MAMEFEILGPVTVRRDGEPVALGGPRQRALLALLLVHGDEFVPTDALIDELWPSEPPQSGATVVQNQVWRLRKALGVERILTQGGGYAVRTEPGELDLGRFRELVRRAEGSEPSARAALLRDALELWHGPPISDVTETPTLRLEAGRLEEARLATLEDRVEADLELGRQGDLVGELATLTARHPLRERLRGQQIRALYKAGRQAEALDVYRETRRLLADELGLEPGPELRELQQAILRQDPSLTARPTVVAAPRTHPTKRRAYAVAAFFAGSVAFAAVLGYHALSSGGTPAAAPAAVVPEPHLPSTPVTISDDFDDGAYDPGRWHVIANGSGIETAERNGRLELALASTAQPVERRPFNDIDAHYGSQCRFPGDFDAEVDYRLLRWPRADGASLAFNAIYANLIISRVSTDDHEELLVAQVGRKWTAIPARGASGSLRLTRRHGIATAYVRRGPDWAQLVSGPSTGTAVLGLQLIAPAKEFRHRAVRVAFDNFSIESHDLNCNRH
jgi:DNA-binding SARP family transcriptional activator